MKFIALWCALLCIGCSIRSSSAATNRTAETIDQTRNSTGQYRVIVGISKYFFGWITQKLDHFNSSDNRTWQQRFHVHAKFYEKGGPIFVIIGEQKEIVIGQSDYVEYTAVAEYAKEFKACCLVLEHRFYGQSRPTNDTSVESLKYLTVGQAMGDVKYFISNFRSAYKIPTSSKVIVFGDNYSGSLAAWLRMNHPRVVQGAVTSNAMFNITKEYREFYENIRSLLTKHSEQCANQIVESLQVINTLYGSDIGVDILQRKMRSCQALNVTDKREKQQFFSSLSYELTIAALHNNSNGFNVQFVCDTMTLSSQRVSFDLFSEINSRYLELQDWSCRELNLTKVIYWLKMAPWDDRGAASGNRQWWHQKCTELGLFETSTTRTELFGENIPLGYFENICIEAFGKSYNFMNLEKNIEKLNKLSVKSTDSQVINVQGSRDPWLSLGLLKDSDQYFKTILIEGISHAVDTETFFNSPIMSEAHKQIKKDLNKWLKSANN